MQTLRKLETLIAIAWLVVFVGGYLGAAWSPLLLAGGLALAALWFAGRRAWPALRRTLRERHPSHLVEVALLPPPERYGRRAPVPLSSLARLLAAAELGRVEVAQKRLRLVTGTGDWLELSATNPDAVTLTALSLRATDAELVVLVCDALVQKLGPFTVKVDGVELFLDGTLPRVELERELRDLQMSHLRRLERELDSLEDKARRSSAELPN